MNNLNINNLILATENNLFSILYPLAAIILPIGLIFFIVNGLLKSSTNKTKGIVNIAVSLGFALIFFLALLIDKVKGFHFNVINYYVFIGVSLLYGIILGLIYLTKRNRDYPRVVKKNVVYTIFEKIEYVYIVYRYKDNVYVSKTKNSGDIIKLKNSLFEDEVIRKEIKEKKIIPLNDEFERNGIVHVQRNEKKEDVYYCFLIELGTDPDQFFTDYYSIDKYDFIKWDMNYFDKEIYMRLILRDFFDIHINM